MAILASLYTVGCLKDPEEFHNSIPRRILQGSESVIYFVILLLGILAVSGVFAWAPALSCSLLTAGGITCASLLLYYAMSAKARFYASPEEKESMSWDRLLVP